MALKESLGRLSRTVRRSVESLEARSKAIVQQSPAPLAPEAEPPPVVARLVVEIRSDGSRTVARGALEDVVSGDKVALEAKGTTPAALAASLAKNLLTMPLLARQMVRSMHRGPDPQVQARPPLDSAAAAADAHADQNRDDES